MTTQSDEPVYGGYGFGELPEPRHHGNDGGAHHLAGGYSDRSEYSPSDWEDLGGQPALVALKRTFEKADDALTRYEAAHDEAVADRPVQERSARDTPGSEVRFRHHDGSNLAGTWARQILKDNDRWRYGFLDLP